MTFCYSLDGYRLLEGCLGEGVLRRSSKKEGGPWSLPIKCLFLWPSLFDQHLSKNQLDGLDTSFVNVTDA